MSTQFTTSTHADFLDRRLKRRSLTADALIQHGPGVACNLYRRDSDDLGSTATVVATDYTQATFTKGAEHRATIRVTDLEPGENVVLRFEVDINCNGESPTGNLQARLAGARVFAPASEVGTISAGDQTVPFKHINQLKPPPK